MGEKGDEREPGLDAKGDGWLDRPTLFNLLAGLSLSQFRLRGRSVSTAALSLCKKIKENFLLSFLFPSARLSCVQQGALLIEARVLAH